MGAVPDTRSLRGRAWWCAHRIASVAFVALLFALVMMMSCTDQTVDRPVIPPADTEEEGLVDSSVVDSGSSSSVDATQAKDAAQDVQQTTTTGVCTTSFGNIITPVFGRLDGTVRAVVVPNDPKCKGDNDHVIVQVDVGGATYKVWINVESSLTPNDPLVRMGEKTNALIGGAWADGWHPNASPLDYATSLNVHTTAGFQSLSKEELGNRISALVKPGAKVSVFLEGFATADGGHKVHRNSNNNDGAVIIDPTSGSPKWLLFHFSSQTF